MIDMTFKPVFLKTADHFQNTVACGQLITQGEDAIADFSFHFGSSLEKFRRINTVISL